MAIKVTFYNDVNFAKDDTGNKSVFNERIQPAAGNFSDGGIYFTPLQNIMNTENPAPAHIIQKSYIYTLGSYVVNDPTINNTYITYSTTETTENTLSERGCPVVTDIISDPYHKLLTVKRTNIKLGKIVETASNAASFIGRLGSQIKTVNLGSYSLTVSITSEGILELSNSKLLADEIEYKYQNGNTGTYTYFDSGHVFKLSKDTYTLQFTTKTDVVSSYIRCDTAENITFGYPPTQLSCQYHGNNGSISSNNIVKVLIPASGWDASTYNANSYTFSVYIKTQGGTKDDVQYAYGEWNVNVTISKTPSPLVLNEPTLAVTDTEQILHNHIFTESNKNDSTGGILTWKMTAMSAQNVKDGWGIFDSTNEKYKMGSAYEMKNAEITVNCTYQCMVNTYSIYNQVKKQGKLKINGGKQWTLNFNNDGTVTSYTAFYDSNFEFPSNPTKTGYSFVGWFVKNGDSYVGNAITSVKAGATVASASWSNHTITLYAKWTKNTQYYWYVGQDSSDKLITTGNYKQYCQSVTNYQSSQTFTVNDKYLYLVVLASKTVEALDSSNGPLNFKYYNETANTFRNAQTTVTLDDGKEYIIYRSAATANDKYTITIK